MLDDDDARLMPTVGVIFATSTGAKLSTPDVNSITAAITADVDRTTFMVLCCGSEERARRRCSGVAGDGDDVREGGRVRGDNKINKYLWVT